MLTPRIIGTVTKPDEAQRTVQAAVPDLRYRIRQEHREIETAFGSRFLPR